MTRFGIRPDPPPPGDVYWAATSRHALCYQRCRRCAHVWHPPSLHCPRCQSPEYAWEESAGKGLVYSYSVVVHAAHPIVADAVPYTLLLVTLDEGPRIVSLWRGDDEPAVGDQVEVAFEATPEAVLPVFGRAKISP